MGHMGTHAAAVALYPNLAYDPVNDFEPIGLAAGTPILILAKKDFPAKDLKEFVAYVKANADKRQRWRMPASARCRSRPACCSTHMLDVKPTAIPFQGTGPVDERAGRRPGRLHVRPDRQRGAADQGRHHQGLCDRHRRSAIRRCRTCRPPRKPACRSSRRRPGTRCSRRRARRSRSLDKLSAALDKALDDEARASACSISAATFPARTGAARPALSNAGEERDRQAGRRSSRPRARPTEAHCGTVEIVENGQRGGAKPPLFVGATI